MAIINDDEYDILFKSSSEPSASEKQKAALKKAWENRDFEIDLFWRRSAYFWGFIALIFGAYISLITSKNFENIQKMHIDLCIILLGVIFSVAWMLVIQGSKRWQENWEAHIDKLSKEITGPLYKIIYCTRHNFYSVSKINFILSWVVIVTWIVLFLQYLFNNIYKPDYPISISKGFLYLVIPMLPALLILLAITGIVILIYCGRSKNGGQKVEPKEGQFIDRTKK